MKIRSFLLNKAGLAILKCMPPRRRAPAYRRFRWHDPHRRDIAGDTARGGGAAHQRGPSLREFRVLTTEDRACDTRGGPGQDLDKYAGADGLQVYGLPITVIRWGAQGGAGIFEFNTMDRHGWAALTQELRA
jgi:hypothetical protein